jgi:hypothetical protein
MSTHIQDACGSFKALIAETPGTPTQKLIAVLAALGVEKTADLAAMIGVGERAIQIAKAKPISPEAKPVSAKPISDAKPISPKTKPVSPRARVEDTYFPLELEDRPVEVLPPLPPKRTAKPKTNGPTPYEALQAFEAYNATALRCGLKQASKLTGDRKRQIIARLKDFGLDGWHRALGNIEKSAFLRGNNNRGWRASLDFMLQASRFTKLHDEAYDFAEPSKFGPVRRTQSTPNHDIPQTAELDSWIRENCLVESRVEGRA